MITATDFAFLYNKPKAQTHSAPSRLTTRKVTRNRWSKDTLHERVLEWCLEKQTDITTRAVIAAFGTKEGTVSTILKRLEERGVLVKSDSKFHERGGRYWVWELAE